MRQATIPTAWVSTVPATLTGRFMILALGMLLLLELGSYGGRCSKDFHTVGAETEKEQSGKNTGPDLAAKSRWDLGHGKVRVAREKKGDWARLWKEGVIVVG